MEEDIEGAIERLSKAQYDIGYATLYSQEEQDEDIKILIKGYKQLEEENEELREEECCMTTCLRKDKEKVFLENKIKEKIEKYKKMIKERPEHKAIIEIHINELQEILEEE